MAFDQSTRNRLQRFVSDTRAILSEEFTRQLQATYGMDPRNGTISNLETLTFLGNEERQTAHILRDTLSHYKTSISGKTEIEKTKQAIDRIIREQAFTILNRLSALRMAEARGFLIESISKGYNSRGFQLYKSLAGTALGETGDAYRQFILSLFDEFSLDLAVVFDRHSSQGRLFPRESALLSVLEQINHFEIESLWAEDETIGWIYQYFNSQEERKKMRAESQAPRNSRELAVRNQFFTPRYVVEFLTDNTLGRIWYEMTQGKTSLVDNCRYLVRRPNEVFLAVGETTPELPNTDNLSQEELLKQTVYIPYRTLKDPREIRMLDPACGSMHFGLYAFDLFEKIYEEAWEIQKAETNENFNSLIKDYPNKEDLLREIPKLIIEHNIHGVDIDSRAVQIAGLSLWQRAQRAWYLKGIAPKDRPTVQKSNIVCAEPMPGNKEMLREFTTKLNPPVLGQLVETIFDKMELAGEAGTLLKIDEEIATAITVAKEAFNKEILKRKVEDGYLSGLAPKRETNLFDFAELTDDTNFWQTAEERILDSLRSYAGQAESQTTQKRLFAEDASRGFAFIDLCRKRFDVVLMNPPFGAMVNSTKEMVTKVYPNSKNDLLGTFVERGLDIMHDGGLVGAITSRACFFLSSFQKWRETVALGKGKPDVMADLGYGVMDDAMVEASAYVFRKTQLRSQTKTNFLRLLTDRDMEIKLLESCEQLKNGIASERVFQVAPESFLALPGAPFAYWVSDAVRNVFQEFPKFESESRTARQGLATAEDFRFVRLWWENPDEAWFGFAKGGAYSPFYSDVYLMAKWFDSGSEIKAGICNRYPYLNGNAEFVAKNTQFYFRPGLTWPRRTQGGLSFRAMPRNCIFADKGPAGFTKDDSESEILFLLAIINSKSFGLFVSLQMSFGSYEVGVIQTTPVPEMSEDQKSQLASLARRAWSLKRSLDTRNENSHAFILPEAMLAKQSSFQPEQIERDLAEIQNQIDEICFTLYNFSEADRRSAVLELNPSADTSESSDEDEESDSPQETDHSSALLSWAMGVVFGRFDIRLATGERQVPPEPEPFDPLPALSPGMLPLTDVPFLAHAGILPQDDHHPLDLSRQIEAVLNRVGMEVSTEISSWLQRDCFDKHLKTYSKSRRQAPVYWPLTTKTGIYRLWLYYPKITNQTLYTCVNDFVEPKLKTIADELNGLRLQSNRSSAEEMEMAKLTELEAELKDFREELLRIASFWKPNLNDGVQITASPLWKLFQHKAWQKKLKETWEALEAGEYDWAHLAYSIWPDRVLRNCRTDRSLAIAHDVESDFWEEITVPGKKGETKTEWRAKVFAERELEALIQRKMEERR
ncbi:BREX-1 system adenine-specific DNA-methyltransferase PglX [Leptospira selangorensis]|uniref:site-specific DNA-methyltransferase (adenine-specific) n=1 Tax=Leptospira selangorensis TaxID=2484982 RepID=A0ABY2NAE8_9LEPT|nr:BREX-1 system adenine-specific DNA-methyltransferase PglX [Leptospira selangorensis]TGM19319.1 BREX-1 system adenine-specific DNA-methyltransferase PglX [Leptospira selangorensis]